MVVLANGQAELRADSGAALVVGDATDYLWDDAGPDWWTGAEVRTFDQARSGSAGYITGRDLLGKHVTVLIVTMLADSESEAGDLIDTWKAATAPSSDDMVTIRANMLGRTRRRYGRFRKSDANATLARKGYVVIGSTQFEALDPLTYGDTENSASTTRVTSSGGVTWPWTWPISWPASTTGTLTVTNSGNVAAPWTARLDGPLTYPEITHLESGRRLSLDFSANGGIDLATGQYVDLDSAARSVLLNGTADRRTQLTIDSAWWDLAIGANTFQLAADAGTGTLTVTALDAFYS